MSEDIGVAVEHLNREIESLGEVPENIRAAMAEVRRLVVARGFPIDAESKIEVRCQCEWCEKNTTLEDAEKREWKNIEQGEKIVVQAFFGSCEKCQNEHHDDDFPDW